MQLTLPRPLAGGVRIVPLRQPPLLLEQVHWFGGAISSVRYLASLARNEQRWLIVALLICVRAISFSMSLIFSTMVDMAALCSAGRPTTHPSAQARSQESSWSRSMRLPSALFLNVLLLWLLVPLHSYTAAPRLRYDRRNHLERDRVRLLRGAAASDAVDKEALLRDYARYRAAVETPLRNFDESTAQRAPSSRWRD